MADQKKIGRHTIKKLFWALSYLNKAVQAVNWIKTKLSLTFTDFIMAILLVLSRFLQRSICCKNPIAFPGEDLNLKAIVYPLARPGAIWW